MRLTLVAFLLGGLVSPGALAQTDDGTAPPDTSQFGGYIVSARGNGLQLTYDSPGLLPTGSPIFQTSVPEALATLNSGNGYALSSFAFPGPLVADLGTALAVSGQGEGVPTYPVRAEAFHPSGPAEASEGQPGTEMTSVAKAGDARALTSYAGYDLAPVAWAGGLRSVAQSVVEGDQVVSRTRTALSDIVLFGGIITIDSVVTDLVATSNGTASASNGRTTVNGAAVLGLPATIDEDGIRFDGDPTADPDNPVGGPVGGALGGALDPAKDALEQVAGPLNELFDQLGIAGDDALQQLFEQTGIEVELLEPVATSDGGTAERTANGLSITMNYDGSNTPVLTELLNLVPSQSLPPENLGPIPFSPQALFNLFKEVHIVGVALAPGNASVAATPAFQLDLPDFVADIPTGDLGTSDLGTGSTGGSLPGADFETATPELPAADPGAGASVPASSEAGFPFGNAVPALAALALLFGAPFFAAGSSRLADNTLSAVATSCPEGLDGAVPQETPR